MPRYNLNIVESGVKRHNPNPYQKHYKYSKAQKKTIDDQHLKAGSNQSSKLAFNLKQFYICLMKRK